IAEHAVGMPRVPERLALNHARAVSRSVAKAAPVKVDSAQQHPAKVASRTSGKAPSTPDAAAEAAILSPDRAEQASRPKTAAADRIGHVSPAAANGAKVGRAIASGRVPQVPRRAALHRARADEH